MGIVTNTSSRVQRIDFMTYDPSTTVMAGAAVTSPWWLQTLESYSEIAAMLMPIAGVTWLVVQTVRALTNVKNWRKKPE